MYIKLSLPKSDPCSPQRILVSIIHNLVDGSHQLSSCNYFLETIF